jgi:hypothetical protein
MPDVYQPDTLRTGGDGPPHISDAPHISPATQAEDARTIMISQISWGAVLAGVVVALVTQIVLNMLGIGIGAATLQPAAGNDPSATSLSVGAGLWFALSAILAAAAGGYAAGRLAGAPRKSTAGWHGLTAWALATLVVFYLLGSTVGAILGGAYHGMTNALGAVASAVRSTAETAAPIAVTRMTDPFSSVEESIRSAIPGNDPAILRDAAIAAVRAVVTGDQQQAAEARERAAQVIARAQNISVEDARTQVQQYAQQYRQAADQAKQQAMQAADKAAKAISGAALFGAISLILGAVVGWCGGTIGAAEPTRTARRAT